jgi:FdhD protein
MFKRKIPITKIKKSEVSNIEDTILIEKSIDIYVNSHPLVNVICLPKNLKELAVGFLFSIGIIDTYNDIQSVEVSRSNEKIDIWLKKSKSYDPKAFEVEPISRVVDTTCGIPSPWRKQIKRVLMESNDSPLKEKSVKIKASTISESIKQLHLGTELFRETGGCHGAGIFTLEGDIIAIKEDIGRHNAIDKVIGSALMKKKSFEHVLLTSTGRLTGDSVLKAIKANIPIFASLAAPIESGVRLAFGYGLTLIGFVRGKRMNIYTHPERVIAGK